ncbi:protein ORF76 [Lake sturgeon herpesvirus]|nr:protein ORF76 [Lake sturgeon herpesvirus]
MSHSSASDLGSNDSERSVDSVNSDVDSNGNCKNFINDGVITKASPDILSLLEKKLKKEEKEGLENGADVYEDVSSDSDSYSNSDSDSNSSGSYDSEEESSLSDNSKPRYKRQISSSDEDFLEFKKNTVKRQRLLNSPTPESLTATQPLSLTPSSYDQHCILLSAFKAQPEGNDDVIVIPS